MSDIECTRARKGSGLVKVELFYTDGCASCNAFKGELEAVVLGAVPGVVWRDVDPLKELDYAVELGLATRRRALEFFDAA